VIIDKGGEKSHKDKKLSCKGGEVSHKCIVRRREIKDMTLERDQLKLRTRVEEQAHESFVAFVCALT
jgi:hypothetical protein